MTRWGTEVPREGRRGGGPRRHRCKSGRGSVVVRTLTTCVSVQTTDRRRVGLLHRWVTTSRVVRGSGRVRGESSPEFGEGVHDVVWTRAPGDGPPTRAPG